MTDRELLEMAAKAIGERIGRHPDQDGRFNFLKKDGVDPWGPGSWNPLSYDGDALRLAVSLHIDLKFYDDHLVAWFEGGFIGTGRIYYEDDPAAASRLAIVLAAAEIGKAM